MSKKISEQAKNVITIVGKLVDCNITTGTNSTNGTNYVRANYTVRVTQDYDGHTETSEIPVTSSASQYTKAGQLNKVYESLLEMSSLKTAQKNGFDNADSVALNKCEVQENYYYSNNTGKLTDVWRIRSPFIQRNLRSKDIAAFDVVAFILDMKDEIDREGDTTGRMIIKGGVVQYGGKLDVVEFIVENPDNVKYISRSWKVNDTVEIKGRIRAAMKEEESHVTSSWGEEIPTNSRPVYELIVTSGSDEGFEDDFAYSATDIKKAFNIRKAAMEEKLSSGASRQAAKPKSSFSDEDWNM